MRHFVIRGSAGNQISYTTGIREEPYRDSARQGMRKAQTKANEVRQVATATTLWSCLVLNSARAHSALLFWSSIKKRCLPLGF